MRLCDQAIRRYLKEGKISLSPLPDEQAIGGVTVDLKLSNQFRGFKQHAVPYLNLSGSSAELARDLERVMGDVVILGPNEHFFLHPGEMVLAMTEESVCLSQDLVGWLDGRSSLARLGLMVHATSHRVDPGWVGQIVLECYNAGRVPLALGVGQRICALSFELLSTPVSVPYTEKLGAKYRGQAEVLSSRLDLE